MGANYSTIAIPFSDIDTIETIIADWLELKGFERVSDSEMLVQNDQIERGIILWYNDKWVIAAYSNFDEEQRLIFELAKSKCNIFHFWLFDSDVWGYELYKDRKVLSAFCSNTAYFGFESEVPGPNDVSLLIEQCKLDVTEKQIIKIQKKYSLFKETICRKFANLIGVKPIANDYLDVFDDLDGDIDDFKIKKLLFRKAGCEPCAQSRQEIYNSNRVSQPMSNDEGLAKIAEMFGEEEANRIRMQMKLVTLLSFIIKSIVYLIILPFALYHRLKRFISKDK